MPAYGLHNLERDPNLAAALGNMVVTWAYTETVLVGTLTRILGTNLNLMLAGYYRIPTFEARIKFIRALIPEWKTDKFDKAAIDHEIGKLSNLAATRNHWVHGDWCYDSETGEIIIFDHRAALDAQQRRKPVKAADVQNHVEAVQERAEKLWDLIKMVELEP